MGTKEQPNAFDCYANAKPDEPMFVILGRDVIGASLVRTWADSRAAIMDTVEDTLQIQEARDCAEAMERYCRSLGKTPRQLALALYPRPVAHAPHGVRRYILMRIYCRIVHASVFVDTDLRSVDNAYCSQFTHFIGPLPKGEYT